ncbi:MAG TPA: hypothetical protein VG405_03720 [Solirubrobacteraceae bacterium]|jgi:hypothetical protein|nr:hypothetical protein [Solirubrobacteraceae bacterium]
MRLDEVQEITTLELAAQYGRDLRDPFGSPDAEADGPPWLNTRFLVGSR